MKSSDKRLQGRKSFVCSESDSVSDYKSSAVCKRRALIKSDKFDGISPTFATFKLTLRMQRSSILGIKTNS